MKLSKLQKVSDLTNFILDGAVKQINKKEVNKKVLIDKIVNKYINLETIKKDYEEWN